MGFGGIEGRGGGTMGSQKSYRIANNIPTGRQECISGRRVQDPFITRFEHKSGESPNLTLCLLSFPGV